MLPRAILSFKVIAEVTQFVASILDRYKDLTPSDATALIIDASLALSHRPLSSAPPSRRGQEVLELCLTAQLRILSVVVVLAKGSQAMVRSHGTPVADSAVRLLATCPPRNVALRRDLLLQLKQMLNSEFKVSFLKHVDVLLDETALLGKSLGSQDCLRDDALFFVTEYVHAMRTELSASQLARAVGFFSKNMQVRLA